MEITVIGAGKMERGIGTRFVSGGHSIAFVDAKNKVAQLVKDGGMRPIAAGLVHRA